ncbi:MAG: hypothetical protein J5780_05315 [Treponema sp.]|nr:hypothetical protein [Treponema sp.]
MNKKVFLSALFLSLTLPSFSVDISRENASWITVLAGSVISPPVRTSYGYAAVCEGKQMTGFTESGKVLWKHSFPFRFAPCLTEGPSDLLIGVTKEKFVTLFNPGGLMLWSFDTGYKVEGSPVNGLDGRIFVRGKNNISCVSLKGKLRWKMETREQDTSLPVCTFTDGSLLVFLKEKHEGKTRGIRVSPFSGIMEEIVFAGVACRAVSCSDGVLLSFSDGSAGLCAVSKKGEAYSKWLLTSKELHSTAGPLIFSGSDGEAFIVTSSGETLFSVVSRTGKVKYDVQIPPEVRVPASDFRGSSLTSQGLFVSGKNCAWCAGKNGVSWKAEWKNRNFSYVFATDSGYLTFCTPVWTIEAFRIKQDVASKKSSFVPVKNPGYREFYPGAGVSDSITGESISLSEYREFMAAFDKGNPLENEPSLLSRLIADSAGMAGDFSIQESQLHVHSSFFKENPAYTERVLNLEAESGLTIFSKHIASMMKKTRDDSLLLCLIINAGRIEYDENGELLSAMDHLVKNVLSRNNRAALEAVCDSTLSICRFMGKPALFEEGKKILTFMLTPAFSTSTNDYARETLGKILELKL